MTDDREDYVWHFRLDDEEEPRADGEEALTEMVHQQISALLRCIQFTCDGRDVTVTGFRFLDDASHEHRLRSTFVHEQTPEEC